MKRALLWLGPLACLALACLYAHAWFTRDPLLDAYERIHIGMRCAEAEAIVDQPFKTHCYATTNGGRYWNSWTGKSYILTIDRGDGRVTKKAISRRDDTVIAKLQNYDCNPSALWTPSPPPAPLPAPPPVPAISGPGLPNPEVEP